MSIRYRLAESRGSAFLLFGFKDPWARDSRRSMGGTFGGLMSRDEHNLDLTKIPQGVFLVRKSTTRGGTVLALHALETVDPAAKRALLESLPAEDRRHVRFAIHRSSEIRS
ncbi:MAG TPA: hypothetical protein VN932_05050, partial [Rhizomicrobium sp.]|nr:hypothetical protein [Rhizomicrobium sp.]